MIALTGITSGVGRRLAEVAIERGHQVRGLVRDVGRDDARALETLGVQLIPGDVNDQAALERLCSGVDAVVHMAAHVGDWGAREVFERVNVEGTRATVEAAARARVKRFVQLSSVAVYGRVERGRITEEWPTRKNGVPYDDTKVEAERIAMSRGAELGLEVAAVRPPVIYGPYDRNFLPRMIDTLRARRFSYIDGGTGRFNLVWVDHVVDVLLLCTERREAVGEAFNVMDTVRDKPPTVRELVERVSDATGIAYPKLSLPRPVVLGLARVAEWAFKRAGADHPPPITPFVVYLTTLDVIYDSSKAVEKLGWEPRMHPLDGIERQARALIGAS
ncbi:MAG TPA: NAD-dependent epimerase/dehydratase family protein [Polyangiaceae bacterium]|nr:NAD-dependent epimerase/dehydratase family protein [Polyangiaceae bacterium]